MTVSGEPGQPGLPGIPGEPGLGKIKTFRQDGFLGVLLHVGCVKGVKIRYSRCLPVVRPKA